jgi:MoaA/NifB/PqqE/SkfB family radical SAM enzyme
MFHEIRIENTNACGYRCVMCPREKMDRSIGYMSLEDFDIVLGSFEDFSGSVHLHGFGEPLLDRQMSEKMRRLKARWPRCTSYLFSTLGVKGIDFTSIVQSGLDVLTVSLYGFTKQTYREVHGVDRLSLVKDNLLALHEAIRESNASVKVYVKIPSPEVTGALASHVPFEASSFLRWIEELGFQPAVWPKLHNYGDGRAFNTPATDRLCPVIEGSRKGILHITWDLSVIPCGLDYNATIRLGSLRRKTLQQIFSSEEYLQFVLAHKTQSLENYPVCQSCDKVDY